MLITWWTLSFQIKKKKKKNAYEMTIYINQKKQSKQKLYFHRESLEPSMYVLPHAMFMPWTLIQLK